MPLHVARTECESRMIYTTLLPMLPLMRRSPGAAVQDLRTRRIRNWLTLSLAWSGLIGSFVFAGRGVFLSPRRTRCSGILAGFALPFVLVRAALGGGDVKLMVGVGEGCRDVLLVFVVAALVGLVIVVAQSLCRAGWSRFPEQRGAADQPVALERPRRGACGRHRARSAAASTARCPTPCPSWPRRCCARSRSCEAVRRDACNERNWHHDLSRPGSAALAPVPPRHSLLDAAFVLPDPVLADVRHDRVRALLLLEAHPSGRRPRRGAGGDRAPANRTPKSSPPSRTR